MAKLEEMGEFVRSASSTIEAPVVRRLKEAFNGGGAPRGGAGSGGGQARRDRGGQGGFSDRPRGDRPARGPENGGQPAGGQGGIAATGPVPGPDARPMP